LNLDELEKIGEFVATRRSVYFVILIFLMPLLAISDDSTFITRVSAADSCSGDIEPVLWNESIGRSALVPHYNYYGSNWGGWFDDMDDGKGNGRNHEKQWYPVEEREPTELNPEEEWMYEYWDRDDRLDQLTTNHHATMLVGNDSIGALRVNLSANHRTTICITLQALNETQSEFEADVYLMTTTEYRKYTELYYSIHSEESYYWDLSETLSEISPEWRSLDFTGWRTYRDAHQYESLQEINFALNLDSPETYNPIFGSGEQWQHFYIVIDTWDNNHDDDAVAPNVVTAADVTIITTERTFVLPTFTVALVFLAMVVGMAILPFIINARYMRSGLDSVKNSSGGAENLVPSLEVEAEIPALNANTKSLDSGDDFSKTFPNLKDND